MEHLIEALRFYADANNWRDGETGIGMIPSDAAMDGGARARRALACLAIHWNGLDTPDSDLCAQVEKPTVSCVLNKSIVWVDVVGAVDGTWNVYMDNIYIANGKTRDEARKLAEKYLTSGVALA